MAAIPASQEIPRDVAQRAVEWMLELQSGPSPLAAQALDDWRAQHASHELAWQRVEGLQRRLGGLSGMASVAHATLGAAAHPRRRAVKALMVLMVCGGVGYTLQQHAAGHPSWRQWAADHLTRPGEQRRIVLADGTQLLLDTDTAVNVQFGASERRLALLRGRVFVTTAKDPGRRFVVALPQGLAQALGTEFSAHTEDDQALVRVFAGAVRITPATGGAASRVLQAGQGAGFTASGVEAPQTVAAADRAWVQGTIIAKSLRLTELLAQLSRYSPHPIRCSDAVADLRVSGAYPVTQIPLILESLSATLGLAIETETRFWGRQVVQVRLVALVPRHA